MYQKFRFFGLKKEEVEPFELYSYMRSLTNLYPVFVFHVAEWFFFRKHTDSLNVEKRKNKKGHKLNLKLGVLNK